MLYVTESSSSSVDKSPILTDVSSSVDVVASTVEGESFTSFTVIVTVAVLLSTVPSLAL